MYSTFVVNAILEPNKCLGSQADKTGLSIFATQAALNVTFLCFAWNEPFFALLFQARQASDRFGKCTITVKRTQFRWCSLISHTIKSSTRATCHNSIKSHKKNTWIWVRIFSFVLLWVVTEVYWFWESKSLLKKNNESQLVESLISSHVCSRQLLRLLFAKQIGWAVKANGPWRDRSSQTVDCSVIDMFEYTAIIRIDTKITCYGD